MIHLLKKKLMDKILGTSAKGVPVSSIKTTTHTCMPDKAVDFNTWANTLQVSSKLKGILL